MTAHYDVTGEGAFPRWEPWAVDYDLGLHPVDLSAPPAEWEVWEVVGAGLKRVRTRTPRVAPSLYSVRTWDRIGGRLSSRPAIRVEGLIENEGGDSAPVNCYLEYGSQTVLIEGAYRNRMVPVDGDHWFSGVARFPRRLDARESDGVWCEVRRAGPRPVSGLG